MRKILWVDVVERDPESDNEFCETVTNSYPFPDLDVSAISYCEWSSIKELRELIEKLEDEITKECYRTKLHFILTRWHPKNFINVQLKDWKYEG